MSEHVVYTIGYAGKTPEAFRALIPACVTIVDVRRYPGCRWEPSYNRVELRKAFPSRYCWWDSLGNAHEGTATEWIPERGWDCANADMEILAKRIRQGETFCLLCAEKDAQKCHRRFVAEEIARRVPGLEIIHL